jgi:hypothetical protein
MAAGWPGRLARWPASWLVNPLLAGINVVLAFVLLTHLFSKCVAGTAAALLAVSPWFVFLGIFHDAPRDADVRAGRGDWHRPRQTDGRLRWTSWPGGHRGGEPHPAARRRDHRPAQDVVGERGAARLRPALAGLPQARCCWRLVLPYNQMLTGDRMKVPINVY